jgi:polysaccharide chain length determinant protein (PEP-CTERM system associated)
MKITNDLALAKLLDIFYLRKGLMIAVFSVIVLLSAYLASILPSVYQSTTLIMVTPQKLPANYVQSSVTTAVEERMRNITEQMLSRTSLERIIKEFNLYPSGGQGLSMMEDRVERLRKNIKVAAGAANSRTRRGDADIFRLSFESGNPDMAMQVTSRLASLLIEENLRVREQVAMGTTSFIDAETQRLRKELEEQEELVNRYKAQHRFELPEQVEANLRTLEQLRNELQNNLLRLASLQQRKEALEKNLAESDTTLVETTAGQLAVGQGRSRSEQLAILLSQYSEKHPDVVRLKQEIQALDTDEKSVSGETPSTAFASGANRLRQTLQKQVNDLILEINALQSKNDILRNQISSYQGRIENTPIRAIELAKVSRSHDITLKKYQDLLAKGLESQLSENMEKKQKGEQFQIVDPANYPQKPARPNRPIIILAGLFLGLIAAFGLAFALENLQLAFKRADEFEAYLDIPVLVTIPAIATRGRILQRRRSQRALVLASVAALLIGVICIRVFGPSFF